MLKIEFTSVPRNGVEVGALPNGAMFRTAQGRTPYLKLREEAIRTMGELLEAVSLESGNVHWFEKKHVVYELDGTLKVQVRER